MSKDPVVQLARMLFRVSEPSARASIIWMISEFQYKAELRKLAPDALRRLILEFTTQTSVVKLQIMNLAVKLSLQSPENDMLRALAKYVLDLGWYDKEFDLRDRAPTEGSLSRGEGHHAEKDWYSRCDSREATTAGKHAKCFIGCWQCERQ